jgi:TRAP-type C4-dicarboxylate transport system permease small subunit
MMLQVIMRYVFNASLSWAEEVSRYAFIWSALVSIGYSIKERSILRVDTFVEALPNQLRNIITALVNCVVAAFFAYLFVNSLPAVGAVMRSGQRSPALEIPMSWVYFSAIVGFLLATIRSFQRVVETLNRSPKEKK